MIYLKGTFSDDESDDERDGNVYERQGYILQVGQGVFPGGDGYGRGVLQGGICRVAAHCVGGGWHLADSFR